MKKLIACLFGLLFSIPAFAITCNLYNVADGWLTGYPTQEGTWSATPQEATIMMHLEEGKKYTIVRVAGSGSTFRVQASSTPTLTHGQSLVMINNQGDENVTTKTITVPNGAPYVLIYIRNNKLNAQTCANGFMIVEGSTAPSEYIPYDPNCPCPAGQVLQTYTSATGTVSQSPAPTPDHPVTPTFYTQGNMILRAVGSGNEMIADSYDASTGKITRRVGYVELDGTETWGRFDQTMDVIYGSVLSGSATNTRKALSNALYFNSSHQSTTALTTNEFFKGDNNAPNRLYINLGTYTDTTIADWKTYLAQQKAAGTPVIIYYPLATETTEDWAAEQCVAPIKIATVKYNNAAFSDVVTGLNTAISTIKTVVANTIAQTAAVASLQSGKQTKPADAACPAGKKCLLVEDSNGTPHWYEIVESYYNPTLPVGYTELAYIESTGTQYIDTGVLLSPSMTVVVKAEQTTGTNNIFGFTQGGAGRWMLSMTTTGTLTLYSDTTTAAGSYSSAPVEVTCNMGSGVTVDGVTTNFSGTATRTATSSAWLFKAQGSSMNPSGRIYYFKIYQNNNLTMDMIPARRESDGVLGMYDLANGQFYTNAGSGTFTAGPVVLPAGYTALQYIQSDGTQYIDTGIVRGNANFVFDGGVSITNASGARFAIDGVTWNTSSYVAYDPSSRKFDVGQLEAHRTPAITLGNKYRIKAQYLSSSISIQLYDDNNVLLGTGNRSNNSWSVSSSDTWWIGLVRDVPAGISYTVTNKIYDSKIYKNNELVFNGIPAKNASNVVGMYDLVTGQFFTNAGSGTFTAGPVAQ